MGQQKSAESGRKGPPTPGKPASPPQNQNHDHAAAVQAIQRPSGVPTVVRWTGGPARSVSVIGSFNQWDSKHGIALSRSGDDFYVILHLEPGGHEFKFLVDGQIKVDPSQSTAQTPRNGTVNTLNVERERKMTASSGTEDVFGTENADVDEGWGQVEEVFEETRKFPPLCPPHLRFTPLNTPPQPRIFTGANFAPHPTYPTGTLSDDPCVLPAPMHVTINHSYFQPRERYNVMGVTRRYREKACTLIYYKPAPANTQSLGRSMEIAK